MKILAVECLKLVLASAPRQLGVDIARATEMAEIGRNSLRKRNVQVFTGVGGATRNRTGFGGFETRFAGFAGLAGPKRQES